MTPQGFQESQRRALEVGTKLFYTQGTQNDDVREYFATSATFPDRLHVVGFHGCDCDGFLHRGRCAHFARFLMYIVTGV